MNLYRIVDISSKLLRHLEFSRILIFSVCFCLSSILVSKILSNLYIMKILNISIKFSRHVSLPLLMLDQIVAILMKVLHNCLKFLASCYPQFWSSCFGMSYILDKSDLTPSVFLLVLVSCQLCVRNLEGIFPCGLRGASFVWMFHSTWRWAA